MDSALAEQGSQSPESARTEAIEAFFRSLDKTLKSCMLYMSKGQLVERIMNELEQKTEAATRDGEVTVKVASFGLVYQGTPIDVDDKRKPYLFRLFCDGARELTIKKGIDRDELFSFIEVLMSDPKEGEDDLVTLLWERNLPHVHLYVADTFSTLSEGDSAGAISLAEGSERTRLNPDTGQTEELALSSDDVRVLKPGESLTWLNETRAESTPSGQFKDMTEKVRSAFQTMNDYRQFFAIARKAADKNQADDQPNEASPLILGQFDSSIHKGNAEALAEMLQLVSVAAERSGVFGRTLQAAIMAPERITKLTGLYEREYETLTPALRHVVKGGEQGLVALLGELDDSDAQRALQEMLTGAGVDLTPFYSKRLETEDEKTLLNTIETLARIGSEPAIISISKTLGSALTSVRHAALEAMVGHYHDAARIGLGRTLKDPSPENRLLALRILQESGEPRVAWAIISTMDESSFEQRPKEEQSAFYSALASFQDDRTLGHFDELFSKKNLLRSRAIIKRQLMAAEALNEINTAQARELLNQVSKRWYIPRKVKKAIAASPRTRSAS